MLTGRLQVGGACVRSILEGPMIFKMFLFCFFVERHDDRLLKEELDLREFISL